LEAYRFSIFLASSGVATPCPIISEIRAIFATICAELSAKTPFSIWTPEKLPKTLAWRVGDHHAFTIIGSNHSRGMFDTRVKINAVSFLKNKFPVAMSKFHLPFKYKEYFFALVFEIKIKLL
jgi:hypothetical protein